MYEIIINKNNEGQKLKKLCFRFLDTAPQSFTYKMLRKKNIVLNDKKATGDEVLSSGDSVKFYLSDETLASMCSNYNMQGGSVNAGEKQAGTEKGRADHSGADHTGAEKGGADKGGADHSGAEASGVRISDAAKNERAVNGSVRGLSKNEIIFEDEDIIILSKPAGVLTQKAGKDDFSLNEMLLSYLSDKGEYNEKDNTFKPSVCNRLDRNTTGIVLAGKTVKGLQLLSGCIKEKRIEKYYMTICEGIFKGSVEATAYLSKDDSKNMVKILRPDEYIRAGRPEGFSCIKTVFMPVSRSSTHTLLRVKLITGKSHQIRAQLAYLGYPVAGDPKYGRRNDHKLRGQLLHAREVRFLTDCGRYSGKSFKCDYPEKFIKAAGLCGIKL
ncbi:MAG: RNA pseudouridine synthase [Eubacterium sp.]|nr:RNA pseudouridine synthase [Eubacterium sp.]